MKRNLIISLGLLLVLLLIGTASFAVEYHEAPMLRVKVAAGELPPVEKRLPEEPVVIEPFEEIGQYGGTWRRVGLGVADSSGPLRILNEGLLKWNHTCSELLPNIAKSWEVSQDGKVYTFHLNKGIKWSDGYPFTADDILFYYEDVLLNKELTPALPGWLVVAGEPGTIEKVDNYTVRFTFAEPYGIFLIRLGATPFIYAPKHYMRQFHPRYVSMDKLEELTKEAGFEFWYQLYGKKDYAWWVTNPERPTIWPWKVTVAPPAVRMVHERNPYYWKVDPEGNQLPYIDYMVHDTIENTEILAFKAIAGEIDMQWRHTKLADYTLYMENRGKGDYRLLEGWMNVIGAEPVIIPNLTCKDLVLRELFQDDRFRKALSLAINRQEINELCFMGLGEPRQASIVSGSYAFSEEWEKAYAEYDPEKANAFLDEIGLTERDKAGFRLRPDGKTLDVILEFVLLRPGASDVAELLKDYWKAIGIKVFARAVDRSLFQVNSDANEFQVQMWCYEGEGVLINPSMLIPIVPRYGIWGSEYARYYATGGKAGEKPPKDIARLQELWDKIKITVDEKEMGQLAEEINQLHIKNIWMIGTVGESPWVVVVKNNFRNIPEVLTVAGICPDNADPEQWFMK